LGQVDGRTSAAVQAWLAQRSPAFREAVEVVVIDPHAGYAAAVRAALPDAMIAVDHLHLVMLAKKAVTAVRQRVTQDLLGRRGRKVDSTWANRSRGRCQPSPPTDTTWHVVHAQTARAVSADQPLNRAILLDTDVIAVAGRASSRSPRWRGR